MILMPCSLKNEQSEISQYHIFVFFVFAQCFDDIMVHLLMTSLVAADPNVRILCDFIFIFIKMHYIRSVLYTNTHG